MQTPTRPAARPVRPRARRVIGLGAIALVVLAACGSSTVSRRVSLVETEGQARFDTATITVIKGETLKLTVVNRSDERQVFRVDELDIERSVAPDSATTLTIEAKRPGTHHVSSPRNGIDPLVIVIPD